MVRHQSEQVADRNLEGTECSWDTTPIAMRARLQKLPEHLLSIDHDYALLWSQGAVLDRNIVSGPTNRHTVARKMGLVRAHTFENPISHGAIFTEGALPRGASALTTEDTKSSFKEAAILCSRKDFSLSRHITDTIPVRSVRKFWLKKCNEQWASLDPIALREVRRDRPRRERPGRDQDERAPQAPTKSTYPRSRW